MAAKIEDYGLIGDCETAALVDAQGSIDWLCWPDFSSEACFAALLGTEENGCWKIAPAEGEWKATRRYRDHTLIHEITFEQGDGAIRLIDFMPVGQAGSHLVRLVQGRAGRVDMVMRLALRFDYGAAVPWVIGLAGEPGIGAVAGPDMTVLRTPVALRGEGLTTVAEFAVAAGETVPFVLTHGASHLPPPPGIDASTPTVAFAPATLHSSIVAHRWFAWGMLVCGAASAATGQPASAQTAMAAAIRRTRPR